MIYINPPAEYPPVQITVPGTFVVLNDIKSRGGYN